MQQPVSLRGLPCVSVVVEDFRRAAEDAGFNSRTFQTDVELKLRMAGISATGEKNWPMLYLNVNSLHREPNRSSAYSISLELHQYVLLGSQVRSDPGRPSEEALARSTTSGITWSTSALGFGPVAHARDTVRDLVDKFVNDWLAVNPLKETAPRPRS